MRKNPIKRGGAEVASFRAVCLSPEFWERRGEQDVKVALTKPEGLDRGAAHDINLETSTSKNDRA